jgi:hypothetical protein
MRPIRQTLTAAGAGYPIALDTWQTPFNVYESVEIPSGTTATVTAQHTPDDLNDPTITTPTWFPDATITAVSVSTEGALTAPMRFVRLNVGSISGGPVYFNIIQGSNRGN